MTNEMKLPNGWKKTVLGEIVEKRSRKVLPSDSPDAKFIGMDCIEPHTLRPTFLYDFKDFKSAGNWFKKNQILYGRMRPYLNKVYKAEFDGACSGEFIVMECSDAFIPELLQYILHARSFVQFVNEKTSGDRPRVSYEEIADYPILLPPRPEQERIVDKIEELLSELETGVKSLKKAQAQLKTYRQAVLKFAFEGQLTNSNLSEGEKPVDWKLVKLGESARFIDYRGKTPKKTDTGIPLITAKNVKAGYVSETPREFIAEKDYEHWMTRGIPNVGDILFTTEAPLGNVAELKVTGKIALAQRIITFQPKEFLNNLFLKYSLLSPQFQRLLNSKGTGTTVKGIKASILKTLEIFLPSREEQVRIVEKIESRLSVCDKLEESIAASFKQSEALRQSILRKAFEGNLVEQDKNDEPIAILLKRIRKEREDFLEQESLRKKNKPRVFKLKNMSGQLKSILQLLEENGGQVGTHKLWLASAHKDDIDTFYAEVKELLDKGKIIETPREGKESFLVLATSK